MHSFASSTFSLPASAEKKFKKTILRRLSLGKDKTSSDLSRSSSAVSLASRSTATLSAAPSEECASRRAFDLFSPYSQRLDIDAYASIPSSPRMPKTPTFGSNSKVSFDACTIRDTSSRVRSSSAIPRASPRSRKVERKALEAPKLFLMSNEVFVIAAPPKKSATTAVVPVPVPVIMPRYSGSSSYSAASSSPMLSSVSSRSSDSWLDNLGISASSEEEMPAFPESVSVESLVAAELVRSRSSLDDIDYQLLANLCEFPVVPSRSPARMTRSESGHGAPKASRGRARSASHQMAPPVPAVPARFTRSHVRSVSAPLSLGPLPPQPSQPPTEAVLRRTDQIKKRYSRQGSPLYTSSPMFEGAESAFLSPRTAPGTPKLDRTLDLKFLEAGLSLDSKVAKRSHKRSASKTGSKSFDSHFTLLKDLKLTPGHIATPKDEEPQEFVSRFSENSDSGRDDASRLFSSLLSHKPGNASASKLPSLCTTYTISDAGTSDNCRRNSGIKTPEMVARSSSSSSSSYSDLPEIVSINADEIVFDLSRPSLDYRQVYAMAQEYAKSSGSVARGAKVASKKKQPAVQNGLDKKAFGLWNKSNRQMLDPVDRSYHLRKY
ncbi:uncharacterized protein UHOD_00801 [Ustilago sp. UG-2017b]|nr:uncharacterized protein UHOD_00801 [Ustilago sp. UG-2017b]